MSEFKFACPVCGQHITADSASAGSQLECPTCYRKIVVPQAPTSTDPKFILSAAEANKPRPPQPSLPALEPIYKNAPRSLVPFVLILLLLLLAGIAAVFFRKTIFGNKPSTPSQLAAGAEGDANEEGQATGKKIANAPVVTTNIAWKMDLADAVFPESAAAGKLRDEFVSCNHNSLQPATLNGAPVVGLGFRQFTRGLPDLSVTIYFFVRQPEELRGKTINIATNDTPAPRVTVRWKAGKETRSESFNTGYALKAELGDIANNRMTGKIYLSLPDDAQSRIAGTFSAEIRKSAHPQKH